MRSCVGLLAAAAILAVGLTASTVVAQERAQDFEATANRLVNQCANINEGDLVLVTGPTTNLKLLEHVAVHVRKLGAFPLISIKTDDMERRMYTEVPEKFDQQAPKMYLKLANMIDAAIMVMADEHPDALADVSPQRIAERQRAMRPVYDTMLNRNVRLVGLGNGLYPTQATARQFGISLDDLTSTFWSGVNVDYLRLQTIGDTVRARLTAGKMCRITDDRGTDFQVHIERRPVHVNDGVISSDEVRQGGAACQAWLPAGEVYFAPVNGTAEGTIVIDRHYFRGREIRDLRLTFKDGKLTSMTARSGLEPLRKLYDACSTGKDAFGAIDIGINPNVRIPDNSNMVAWMASGSITIGIGNNTWAGGDNHSDFALYIHLRDATLMVDGRKLIDNGTLQP